jgi:RimJ/RimL family protein N-acetyltransferase
MTTSASTTFTKVEYSTTIPSIGDNLPKLTASHLILRPLLLSDLEAYYALRSDLGAMTTGTVKGKPDANIDESLAKLQDRQPPYQNSHACFGIFLKKPDGSEGELIGEGGMHSFFSERSGWPELGYKFKKEHWGKGYATEFVKTFLEFWVSLPRTETRIEVALSSVKDGSGRLRPEGTEQVIACTLVDNWASQRVLEKVGFESFEGLDNGFINWRKMI